MSNYHKDDDDDAWMPAGAGEGFQLDISDDDARMPAVAEQAPAASRPDGTLSTHKFDRTESGWMAASALGHFSDDSGSESAASTPKAAGRASSRTLQTSNEAVSTPTKLNRSESGWMAASAMGHISGDSGTDSLTSTPRAGRSMQHSGLDSPKGSHFRSRDQKPSQLGGGDASLLDELMDDEDDSEDEEYRPNSGTSKGGSKLTSKVGSRQISLGGSSSSSRSSDSAASDDSQDSHPSRKNSVMMRALSRTFSFFRDSNKLDWKSIRGCGGRKEGYVELRDLTRMDMCGLMCGIDCHPAVFQRKFVLLKGHFIFVFDNEESVRPTFAIDVLPVTFVSDKEDGQIDLEVEGVLRFEMRMHTKTEHNEWLMALRALQAAAVGGAAKKELGHGLLSTQSSLDADKIGTALNKDFELPFEDAQAAGIREM